MLRTLVVTHVLLDYRYMDDVTENFFFVQFTWCAVLKMFVNLFRIERVKASKKVYNELFTERKNGRFLRNCKCRD